MKIWNRNLDQLILKRLNLQTYQQLCSMTSICLGKICVHFPDLLHLKSNETAIFFFKINQNNVKSPFFLKSAPFCYVMFGGYPKTKDKVYNNQVATLKTEKNT